MQTSFWNVLFLVLAEHPFRICFSLMPWIQHLDGVCKTIFHTNRSTFAFDAFRSVVNISFDRTARTYRASAQPPASILIPNKPTTDELFRGETFETRISARDMREAFAATKSNRDIVYRRKYQKLCECGRVCVCVNNVSNANILWFCLFDCHSAKSLQATYLSAARPSSTLAHLDSTRAVKNILMKFRNIRPRHGRFNHVSSS